MSTPTPTPNDQRARYERALRSGGKAVRKLDLDLRSARADLYDTVREAHADPDCGLSYAEIAASVGLSRDRIIQIVRADTPEPEDTDDAAS